jgi:hypothetical protein
MEIVSKKRRIDGGVTTEECATETNEFVNSLISEITIGLCGNSDDPIEWLADYVDTLKNPCAARIIIETDNAAAKARPPKAIIVDLGTGESKVLSYFMKNGTVNMHELDKIEAATTYLDKPESFCNKIKCLLRKENADVVIIAASAWLRNADGNTLIKGNNLLQELMGNGIICKILEKYEESWFELVSVEYAVRNMEKNLEISGVWAAGAGSTQISMNFENIMKLQIGNKRGEQLLLQSLSNIEQWKTEVRVAIAKSMAVSEVRLSGLVWGMSAVYFAAVTVGLPAQTILTYEQVHVAFSKYIDIMRMESTFKDEDARSLANVIQQCQTLEIIASPNATFYFARDVVINGNPFRITWSCGSYIQLLDEIGVENFSGKSLNRFREVVKTYRNIGKNENQGHSRTTSSTLQLSTVGEVLVDLETAVDSIMKRACALECIVTPLLQDLVTQVNARVEGLDYRFKTRESLLRKLKCRLHRLLANNLNMPLFIPRVADILHEVDDTLRYTVVGETADYTNITTFITSSLKTKLGDISIYNFWSNGSTYYGANTFVNAVDAKFTFELQFHTSESWAVKQNKAHIFYEIYRECSDIKRTDVKLQIYRLMKEAWSSVPIPPCVEAISPPTPMVDKNMEQIEEVKKYTHLLRNPAHMADTVDYSCLCSRLVRGKKKDEFLYLSYPYDQSNIDSKKIVWVADSETLHTYINASAEDLIIAISKNSGKSIDFIREKLHQGYRYKLYILPISATTKANWDGLFMMVKRVYPEVARKIMFHENSLKRTSFHEIEGQIGEGKSFRGLKDAGPAHEGYMNVSRLTSLPKPLLWQVRGFLYNVIGANEMYTGDGFLYNDKNERICAEYICENKRIAEIAGCEIVDLL